MTGIIFIIIAYLLGSLSSAVIVCQLMKLPDPRTQGSGNPGATNVLRIAGRNAALLTLLGDGLKGFLPVIFAKIFGVNNFMLGLVAVGAVAGHIFPVFFKFKGGKGVATALGGVLGISFFTGIIAIIAWFAVVYITKYASLASLVAIILAPVMSIIVNGRYFIPLLLLAAVVIWRHWDNINRLMDKSEDKLDISTITGGSSSHATSHHESTKPGNNNGSSNNDDDDDTKPQL